MLVDKNGTFAPTRDPGVRRLDIEPNFLTHLLDTERLKKTESCCESPTDRAELEHVE
jgi:hypothetical protein